ncbi:MAG: crotonase/enoyl-CoA hydratase family protein [Henriciella sp.]|nr:crotonase/enoyl-CoA hydratase family protein [Henriciella sp.]
MQDRVTITMLEDGIADVRLIRSNKMNALDPAMFRGLTEAIDQLKTMPGLRVVVLSAEGPAFCAGLDLSSFGQSDDKKDGDDPTRGLSPRTKGISNDPQYVAYGWREIPAPVIAAAHGVAFGGGLQLLSGADVKFIHPETRCAVMEMKWGLVPDMAGFPLWRENVRGDLLRELTYTNREFSGREAVEFGFATHVSDTPQTDAMALAKVIALKNPHAVRAAKRLFTVKSHSTDAELLQAESVEQDGIIRKPNQVEAVMASMEKRKPEFVD